MWKEIAWEDIRIGDEVQNDSGVSKDESIKVENAWVDQHDGWVLRIRYPDGVNKVVAEQPGQTIYKWHEPVPEKWELVKAIDLKVGDRIKENCNGVIFNIKIGRIEYTPTPTQNVIIYKEKNLISPFIHAHADSEFERLQVDPDDLDPWKTLKKAAGTDERKPKEIPKWPDRCPHCTAPAYIGLNDVDCSMGCPGSRK